MAFVINVALVVYLVVTKRLFGVRGGKKAYEARLRSASILQAEIDALAAGAAPARRRAAPQSQAGRSAAAGQAARRGRAGAGAGSRGGPDGPAHRRHGRLSPATTGPAQPTDAAATSSSAAE